MVERHRVVGPLSGNVNRLALAQHELDRRRLVKARELVQVRGVEVDVRPGGFVVYVLEVGGVVHYKLF